MTSLLTLCLIYFFIGEVVVHVQSAAVTATTNVALDAHSVVVKSTYKGNVGKRLIDNIVDPVVDHGSCSIAKDESGNNEAYFRISLDKFYEIGMVVAYNRMDCCSNRSNYLIVGLANSTALGSVINQGTYPLCGIYPGIAENVPILTINCDTSIGPVNNIIIQGDKSTDCILNLCEVKAFVKIDGVWGDWTNWSAEDKTCGVATVRRTRVCDNPPPANNGEFCPGDPFEVKTVTLKPCPINGKWGPWSEWSGPIYVCGPVEQQNRVRRCTPPQNGGLPCTGLATESRPNSPVVVKCPVNGNWGQWSDWSPPSLSCGGTPTITRTRLCNNPTPQNNGAQCVGNSTEVQSLPAAPPCPINGIWGIWSAWTSPSLTCGGAPTVSRTRLCNNPPPSNGGAQCVGDSIEIKTLPNAPPCPVVGNWSAWSPWSGPPYSCGPSPAVTYRERTCLVNNAQTPSNYCVGCSVEITKTPVAPCKINGNWSPWGNFSAVSVTCGSKPATKTRSRTCTNPPASGGGAACPGFSTEIVNVDVPKCDDMGWSDWGEWSRPSFTCGDRQAVLTRTRVCQNPTKLSGGYDCVGRNTQSVFVDVPPCEVDHGCPARFSYNEKTGRCYYLVGLRQTWEDARNFCNNIHPAAHLVMPTNYQDFEDLTDYLNTINYQITTKCQDKATGKDLIWTAGQKEGDRFVWKPYNNGDFNNYFPFDKNAWVNGSPDNYLDMEDCVHLLKTPDGYRLSDIACSATGSKNYKKIYNNFDTMCGICEIELAIYSQ